MRLTIQDVDLLVTIYKNLNAEGGRPDLAAALLRMIDRLLGQNDGVSVAYLLLNREQVEKNIPYKVICEAREGAHWDTGTRKRRWDEEFTAEEQHNAMHLFRQAQTWALKSGVPASVKMSSSRYDLWKKLGDFCASL